MLVARLRHLRDAGRIADDLLARFGLNDAAERKVSAYSGGMRRRLDIAMSLIGDPAVIILDEPTTGLDPQVRVEVWNSVRELAEGGTTVLLTTQYLNEAEQLADRIAILQEGRIIANGALAELKQLIPPAKVEYVEKQPSLEDVFLAIVGAGEIEARPPGSDASSTRTSCPRLTSQLGGQATRGTRLAPEPSSRLPAVEGNAPCHWVRDLRQPTSGLQAYR